MTSPPSDREKRRYDRVRLNSSKRVWDLSEGGAYVASTTPKKTGSVIHFEFRFEKGRPAIKALAKVVRVQYKANPRTGEPAGMALQFMEMGEEDRANLRSYLEREKRIKQAVDPDRVL